MSHSWSEILSLEELQLPSSGPLYIKLRQLLEEAIRDGRLKNGDALPPERDFAEYANVSRVTIRKAIDDLVSVGQLVRKHGSGTFVQKAVAKVQQPLSRLTSFTEDMTRRGLVTRAEMLERGLYQPTPEEMMMLGLGAGARVARISRLRIADDMPLAIERASLSEEYLPDPGKVDASLYAELDKRQLRPVRAIQRISACNIKEPEASQLGVPAGSAGLSIERISYLASGKVIEFTRSLYRGDAYDFIAELTIGDP